MMTGINYLIILEVESHNNNAIWKEKDEKVYNIGNTMLSIESVIDIMSILVI